MSAGETPRAEETAEGMLFRRLSDALTDGRAGTWDEVEHAAAALREQVKELQENAENILQKDRVKTREINLLTQENRALSAEVKTRDEQIASLRVTARIYGDGFKEVEANAQALREALETVASTFEKDESQGYHSRDRQFAISILRGALTAPSSTKKET